MSDIKKITGAIKKITGAELKIVEILLETKQLMTVSDLMTVLKNMNIDWSPETIRKFMERLENKGVVASNKKGKSRYYYIIVSAENIDNDEAKKVVDFHFQGSLTNFLSAFTRKNKLSKDEVEQIRDWADKLDDE